MELNLETKYFFGDIVYVFLPEINNAAAFEIVEMKISIKQSPSGTGFGKVENSYLLASKYLEPRIRFDWFEEDDIFQSEEKAILNAKYNIKNN